MQHLVATTCHATFCHAFLDVSFQNAIGDTGGCDLSQSFVLRPEQSHIHDSTLGTRSALDPLEMAYADKVGSKGECFHFFYIHNFFRGQK
jgi:hypothetical protein